jgi:CheY-like chemotaxis protein
VLSNLLNNACAYTPPGGVIRVTAERHGGEAIVSVTDTGTGIPPEMLEVIFEMFSRGDPQPRAGGGLGIGLSLAKRLVEMHGGSITAQSQGPGRGSSFTVRLPALADAVGDAAAGFAENHCATPAESTVKHRVLVVDDNSDAAATLVMALEQQGHEAKSAHDGREALAQLEDYRPSVILLDIGLPEMNGYEVCREIRRKPWGDRIAIVAVTGWGQDEDRRRSAEAKFDAHLVKPIDLAALSRLLDEAR